MFNCEWRKHCLPDVCAYVCVLSMHLTLTTTGGGPPRAHIAEGCGYVTATRGPATPDWNRTGSKCTKPPPPILINTTYLRQTEQITPEAQPPAKKQARITSQPDYSVCTHSQPNGTSVVRDESGEARAWLLIWSYLFSSSCRTLSYNLEPQLSPPPTPKKPLTESDRFICCTLMDGCSLFILRLWFQERKLPMPKTEWALSVGVHCCGSGQGFYSLLGKKEVHPQM